MDPKLLVEDCDAVQCDIANISPLETAPLVKRFPLEGFPKRDFIALCFICKKEGSQILTIHIRL